MRPSCRTLHMGSAISKVAALMVQLTRAAIDRLWPKDDTK